MVKMWIFVTELFQAQFKVFQIRVCQKSVEVYVIVCENKI